MLESWMSLVLQIDKFIPYYLFCASYLMHLINQLRLSSFVIFSEYTVWLGNLYLALAFHFMQLITAVPTDYVEMH